MDKSGVSKEAQDDALSDDTTGGRQTPTGRPTRGNVAPTTVFYLSFLFAVSGGGDLIFFLECRTSSIFAKSKGAGAKQKQLIASTHGCDGFCRLE